MYNPKKILVLKSNADDFERYFSESLRRCDLEVYPVYKERTKLGICIAIVLIRYLKIPFQSWNYGKWKKHLKKYDQIIVFYRVWSYSVLQYIRKKHKQCKLIFWCWNKKEDAIPQEIRECCEVWSFDEADCEKYNLHHNMQFYYPLQIAGSTIEQDVYFVGKEKNRGEDILNTIKMLEEKKYRVKCEILSKNKEINEKYRIDSPRPYEYVIKEILKSKCILDIGMKNQSGITLRVLEALFYKKKLITNNARAKELPFYCPNNIYILSENNEDLEAFMEGPYDSSVDKYQDEFSIQRWLENFER